VRETLSGTEDRLFLPLDCHFGDESLIILIELERDINCADEVADGIVLKVDVKQVVSAEKGYCIVYNLLEFEGVV
jgi:hypothetical protein